MLNSIFNVLFTIVLVGYCFFTLFFSFQAFSALERNNFRRFKEYGKKTIYCLIYAAIYFNFLYLNNGALIFLSLGFVSADLLGLVKRLGRLL